MFRACLHGSKTPQVGAVIRLAVVEKCPRLHANLPPLGPGVKFLEVVAWSRSTQAEKMAGERRILVVSVLFFSLAALAETFQCCVFCFCLFY